MSHDGSGTHGRGIDAGSATTRAKIPGAGRGLGTLLGTVPWGREVYGGAFQRTRGARAEPGTSSALGDGAAAKASGEAREVRWAAEFRVEDLRALGTL